ncbi:MAG: tetratricopeptide repeat protein [Pedobacter sp.]|nr:MAG: tetratricopeptide repeat protein [Pedobacter sp.]
MLLKAFFKVCIYGFLLCFFVACSAQKKLTESQQINSSKTNTATAKTLHISDNTTQEREEVTGKNDTEKYIIHLEKAASLAEKGDTISALKNYELAIQLLPQKPDAYEFAGYLLADSRMYKEAVERFQKAVDLGAANVDLFGRLGFSYARIEKYPEAVNYLSKAINLNPANIENYAHRAFALIETEQYERAEADYKIFLLKNPNDAISWFNISRAQYSSGKADASIFSLQKVLALDPDFPNANFRLGLAYAAKQDYNNALQAFDKAIIQTPTTGFLYFNRGIAKGKLKRNDFCADFKKALELGFTEAQQMVNTYCK